MKHLHNDILNHYDYANDPDLEEFRMADRAALRAMLAYGGANHFGRQMTAHQNRVAKDGAAFLRYSGFGERAATNFRAALLFHDIGKTHPQYAPDSWLLEDRPPPDLKTMQRQHARRGGEMLSEKHIGLVDHPHFQIRDAVTRYHHERLDGGGPEEKNVGNFPLFVQIACIVDAYDGDRIQRPHQARRRSVAETLARLADGSGKYAGAFDSALLARYKSFKENQA